MHFFIERFLLVHSSLFVLSFWLQVAIYMSVYDVLKKQLDAFTAK